jgi:hypothetical protein
MSTSIALRRALSGAAALIALVANSSFAQAQWKTLLSIDAAKLEIEGIKPPYTFAPGRNEAYNFKGSYEGWSVEGVMDWDGKQFIGTYPPNFRAGSGRYNLEGNIVSAQAKQIRVTLRGSVSQNAQGNPIEWKRVHFFRNGRNIVYLTFTGADNAPLVPHLALQGIPNLPGDIARMTDAGPLRNNIREGVAIERGRPHEIIVELADRMKLWVNGTLVSDYPNYLPPGIFDTVKDNATWGGGAGVVRAPMSVMTSALIIEGRQ